MAAFAHLRVSWEEGLVNATEFSLSNIVVKEIVRTVEDIITAASECEEAEGRTLSVCGFSGFKDVVDCLHLTVCDTNVLDAEMRVSKSSSADWLCDLDPFLFTEILSTKSIGLTLTN